MLISTKDGAGGGEEGRVIRIMCENSLENNT